MKSYCPKCDKLAEVKIKDVVETFKVKGEEIKVNSKVAFCKSCENKVFNAQLDENNLNLAFSKYRHKHNLLTPSEISEIRKKYLLSQRGLSRLLGWGEVTVNRYENGAVQNHSHNEVLMLIEDPENMKKIFEKNRHLLNSKERENLEDILENLEKEERDIKFRSALEDYISSSREVNEYTGFKGFNLEKLKNVILYIVKKLESVYTTKLNKLLWYSDFLNFKEFLISITGSNYVHLPYGPVPDNYEWIFADLVDKGLLKEKEVIFSSGAGSQYKTSVNIGDLSLDPDEKRIIDFVVDFFKSYDCRKIKRYSHKEKAYQKTKDLQKISYRYADSLSIELNGN